MWELDHKEGWVPVNWHFWTVVLENRLESPLNSKEIKPVNSKGNQSWIFIAEAEAPVLWPPNVKNWLILKGPDDVKDWRQEKKGMTENEMVGWHHRLDGPEFEWASGVGDGQRSLACCSPWNCNESDTTEWLNWTEHTQHRRLMVERSDKTWSTGEGNSKPLWYSCLENFMNSMERQKDMTLKEELPRVGRCPVCYWRRVKK